MNGKDQFEAFYEKASEIPGLKFLREEPLREHGSFRIGGNAAFALFPQTEVALVAAVRALREEALPYAVVGKGSNLLFPDEGYRGAVIFTGDMQEVSIDGTAVTAASGASFTALAATAGRAGLTGLEFAYGIPGSVGGAVCMNAGAYGGEVAQVLFSSRYFDCETGQVQTLAAEQHRFGYRESFYREHPGKVILSATFALAPGDPDGIKAKMDELMARRRLKQPLEYPSAGSTFKRPEGNFAGKLIEEAGLKGLTVGGAQVSEKHAGFVINKGGATAADVKALISEIRRRVFENAGVHLEREVIYFGEK